MTKTLGVLGLSTHSGLTTLKKTELGHWKKLYSGALILNILIWAVIYILIVLNGIDIDDLKLTECLISMH